jgi:hypothetical protein
VLGGVARDRQPSFIFTIRTDDPNYVTEKAQSVAVKIAGMKPAAKKENSC